MGNAFAEFVKGLDATTRNLPQMLMFAQQRDEQRQARNREIELKLGQERIQMGFKLAEIMKGNPEGQKEALMKFVVPGFQSLSKGGAVSYSEDEITKFVSSVDLSNKMGQNLINSLIKISSNQDMPAQEKLGAFNVALSGYQGELSKTQFEGVKGMGEQLKEEVNPKGDSSQWKSWINDPANRGKTSKQLIEEFKNIGSNDKTESEKVFQLKIKSLEDAYPGLSHADAVGLINGTIKVVQDPVTKEAFKVDLVNNKQYPLSIAHDQLSDSPATDPTPEGKGISLWSQANKSTGPMSTIKDVGSRVTGIFGGSIANETIQARQNLKSAQQNLIRSLAINDKYAVAEQNRIKEEINISPQLLDNPEHLRQRMIAVSEYLKVRYDDEIRDAYDRSLSVKTRQSSREIAKAIKHYSDMLGVPQIVRTEEDYLTVQPGQEFIDDKGNRRIKK